LGSLLDQFDAAIEGAAVFSVVGSDRRGGAVAERLHPAGRDVVRRSRKRLHNGSAAALGQVHVRGNGAHIVGMTNNLDLKLGILSEHIHHCLQRRRRLGFYFGLSSIEEDPVHDGVARAANAGGQVSRRSHHDLGQCDFLDDGCSESVVIAKKLKMDPGSILVDNKRTLTKSGILLKGIPGGMQRTYQIAQYWGGGDALWKSIYEMGEVPLYVFACPIGDGEANGIVIPMLASLEDGPGIAAEERRVLATGGGCLPDLGVEGVRWPRRHILAGLVTLLTKPVAHALMRAAFTLV